MRPQKSLTGNGALKRHLYLADTFECDAVIHQLNAASIELPIDIDTGIGIDSECKCKCYQVFGVR